MVDSGLLKATLDIFVDYFQNLVSKGKPASNQDESFLINVGEYLVAVLVSKASALDLHLQLYAFRALSLICKVHDGFRQENAAGLI